MALADLLPQSPTTRANQPSLMKMYNHVYPKIHNQMGILLSMRVAILCYGIGKALHLDEKHMTFFKEVIHGIKVIIAASQVQVKTEEH